MPGTLTVYGGVSLFIAMLVLAFVPGVSVMAVTARSAASGFVQGVFTTLGIIAGDIVYIIIAIYGLSVAEELMGGRFYLVRYLGAAYLIWFGIELWLSKEQPHRFKGGDNASSMSSFLSGLLITLGDQKAILFYLGFFPAFLELSLMTYADTFIVIMIATVAVGSAKLVYAYMADRAVAMLKKTGRGINAVAGSVMLFIGISIVVMT